LFERIGSAASNLRPRATAIDTAAEPEREKTDAF